MKKFKLSIFMIFLVMILAVSAVSAADFDDSSDADALASDAIDEVVSTDAVEEVEEATADVDVVAADEGNNFTSLNTKISEATNNITLDKNYTRVAGDNDIVIDKNFTIDGQGKYTIDANKLGRVFKVNAGSTLTLKGLTLINGTADNGGAIFVNQGANLVIDNVIFTKDIATYYGGAIYTEGNISITKSIFDSNDIATKGDTENEYGASAIYATKNVGSFDVSYSNFTNNIKGGNYSSWIVATVMVVNGGNFENCIFVNNSAAWGGAIAALGYKGNDRGKLTVKNSRFEDNAAYYGAGILSQYHIEVEVDNCQFINNNVTGTSGSNDWSSGGAFYAMDKVTLKNSNFTNNYAQYNGGAVYLQERVEVEGIYGNSTIDNCIFKDNVADSWYGAVRYTGNHSLSVSNSKFINNTAKQGSQFSAGALAYGGNKELSVEKTEFTNNTGIYGGAISFLGYTLNVKDSTFTGNTASNEGGAIYIDRGEAEITDSKFEKNTAKNGTVYNKGALTVNNNTFDEEAGIVSENPVTKPGSNVTIAPIYNVTYGEPVVVYYTTTNGTGNVSVKIYSFNGAIQTLVEDANYTIGTNNVTIYNLTANKYRIDIFNNENDNFAGNSSYALFTVKPTSSVTIEPIADTAYGSPVVVKYNIQNRSSNVTVSIRYVIGELQPDVEGAICTIADDNVTVTNLTVGKYIIYIFNNEDDNVGFSRNIAVFNVTKANPTLELNAKVNEYGLIVIEATPNKDATGNVTFIVTNETGAVVAENTENIINGTATFAELAQYAKGKYNYTVIYNGDSNYNNITKTSETPVEISKNYTAPTTELVNVTGGQVEFIIDLGVNATGNVTVVYLSGYKENVTIAGGKVKFNQTFMKQGNLKVVLDYDGDEKFYGFYGYDVDFFIKYDSNLTVKAEVNEFGHIVINATVNATAKGTIIFVITNETGDVIANVTKEIVNGTASYNNVTTYPKGKYSYDVYFTSSDGQFEDTVYALGEDLVVDKDSISSDYEAVVTYNQAKITITFPANATGNLTIFYSSGANKTMPINSTIVLDYVGIENGNQWVLITYPGDEKYYGFNNYNITFFVKTTSFIKAGNVNVVYLNNGKVTVTLTSNDDGKGNLPIANAPVTITLNGKTYKGTTNPQGIATITIAANLVPKVYTAKVVYAGTETCYGDDATFTFTVKKATPKLTAKKKTFKAKTKVKKYTIVLKNNKNKVMKKVKVTLKVKGKTYTAKTNAKGKATFKIKNLKKKGTYKAKVTFKATKYFNKVTKTVKIKVKR